MARSTRSNPSPTANRQKLLVALLLLAMLCIVQLAYMLVSSMAEVGAADDETFVTVQLVAEEVRPGQVRRLLRLLRRRRTPPSLPPTTQAASTARRPGQVEMSVNLVVLAQ